MSKLRKLIPASEIIGVQDALPVVRREVAAAHESYQDALENLSGVFAQAYTPLYMLTSAFDIPEIRQSGYGGGAFTFGNIDGKYSDVEDLVYDGLVNMQGKELSDFFESKGELCLVLDVTRDNSSAISLDLGVLRDNNDRAKVEGILAEIFPTYKPGTKGRWLRKMSTKDILQVDWKPSDAVSPENFGTGMYEEGFEEAKKFVTIDYEILAETRDYSAAIAGNSKDAFNPSFKLEQESTSFSTMGTSRIFFRVRATVKFKKDFIAWATHSDVDKIRLSDSFLFLQQAYKAYDQGRPEVGRYVGAVELDKRLRKFGDMTPSFQRRANARGWSINPNGMPFKWPAPEDNTKALLEYSKEVDELLLKVIESKSTDEPIDLEKAMSALQDRYTQRVLFADWVNDRALVSVTSGSGFMDISSVIPMDAVTEAAFLNTELWKVASELSPIFAKMDNYVVERRNKIRRELVKEYQNSDNYVPIEDRMVDEREPLLKQIFDRGESYMSPATAFNFLVENNVVGSARDIRLMHICGHNTSDLEDSVTYAKDMEAIKVLQRAVKGAMQAKDFLEYTGFSNNRLKGLIGLTLEYMSEANTDYIADIFRQSSAELSRNTFVMDKNTGPIELPNITVREGVFEALMPHQVETALVTAKDPKITFLDISAGGGKTISIFVSVLQNLQAGLKRPLIMTSGDLIPSFITEGNAITNGKINFISLRVNQIEHLLKVSKITSAVEFIRWVRNQPVNTIFFTTPVDMTSSRVLFEDWEMPISYMGYEEGESQYAQIMKACGFQTVKLDESHKIKNEAAQRSSATTAMLARAERKLEASGTLISNTVLDLRGQTQAVNPAIFGTQDQFIEEYGINNGILRRAEEGGKIRDRLRGFSALVTKRKSDWAFLLPDIKDHFIDCEMTANQTTFYNKIMEQALVEVQESMHRILSTGRGLDEDEMDRRMEIMLRAALVKVEKFLLDPTSDADYMSWAQVELSPQDLISPKVAAVDKTIRDHMASDDGKIIVFSTLKVGSKHQMEHSAFKNVAVHYTAGDLNAIRRFKEDPSIKIMFADSTSMREGHNLQVSSAVISIQSVWAPGDFEQYISRMYRPDPRGKYNRKMIHHYWIVSNKMGGGITLDTAKICRFISKSISNAHVSNDDTVEWLRLAAKIDDLPMIKMNMSLIVDFTREDAEKYFRGWKMLKEYETEKNRATRRDLGRRLESIHGIALLDEDGNVLDVREFLKYSMREVKEAPMLEGSKTTYAPWVAFAEPADPHGLGLELVNDNDVVEGMAVWTEFGPAIVERVNAKTLKVKASHGSVVLNRECVAMAGTPEKAKQLAMLVKSGEYAVVPYGVKAPANKGLNPKRDAKLAEEVVDVSEEKVVKPRAQTIADVKKPMPSKEELQVEEEEEDEDDEEELDIEASVVNGLPALICTTDTELLEEVSGWANTTPFVQISFSSWRYAEEFLDKLDDKFYINPKHLALLYGAIEDMKVGRSMRVSTLPNSTLIRNFFLDNRRKLRPVDGYSQVKPYWISWNTKPRLLFDISAHAPEVLTWLARAKRIQGVKTVTKNDGFWLKFYKTMTEAKTDMSDTIRALRGKAIFDKVAIKDELIKANKLLKEMKLNTKSRK